MVRIARAVVAVFISFITVPLSVSAVGYYQDDYRDKLIALYECLDEQMSQYELTEKERVQFDTGGIAVAARNRTLDGAVQWDDARKIMAMLCGEHPRFLSTVNNMGYYTNSSDPNRVVSIDMKRLDIDETYEDAYNELDSRADSILKEIIKDEMSELDKVYAVYIYLMKNCETVSTSGSDDRKPDTIYGVLIENRGACGGFANTFKLLTDKMGIESEICNSRSKGHLWNYVKVDGLWYHLDASAGASSGSADYFLVSDDERKSQLISQANGVVYDWESINDYVDCSSHKFDHGYIFDNFSGSILKSIAFDDGGGYSFDYAGEKFRIPSLYVINNIISVPRSNLTGETADVSGMKSSYSVMYGSERDFDQYIICSDDSGNVLKAEKRKISFDSSNRRVDMSVDAPEETKEIRIYSWNNGMSPVANVMNIRD